jgi:hypothetical protein
MRYFYLLLGLFGIAALNLVRPMHGFTSSGFSSEEHDEADDIVRRSYANSYARLVPCNDDDDDGNAKGAGKGELWNPKLWKSCVVRNLAHFNNTNSTAPSIPWWLLTLLRDTQRNMAYGPWHRFGTTEPPLNFCAIEKVGSTEWRRVFCDANADDCVREPKRCTAFRGKKCAFMTTRSMPKDAPWAVFLRDPLERILSGFLDKCYNAETRKIQGHCEPNVLFNPRPNMRDARGENYPSLMEHLEGKDKQFFAAYLDVFPGEVSSIGLSLDFMNVFFHTSNKNDTPLPFFPKVEHTFLAPSNIMQPSSKHRQV